MDMQQLEDYEFGNDKETIKLIRSFIGEYSVLEERKFEIEQQIKDLKLIVKQQKETIKQLTKANALIG